MRNSHDVSMPLEQPRDEILAVAEQPSHPSDADASGDGQNIVLALGIPEMPHLKFQVANFTSAFVWAWALLMFGDFGSPSSPGSWEIRL